ncbi:MAG: hypothetical protein QOD99_2994 [Chthoniobacter sp.]|jgi:hypothetical protein|nr:hypothetical protein [Chthoniobacter sp.]
MKLILPLSLLSLLAFAPRAGAAENMSVTVAHELDAARPAETITVPWSEIAKRLPNVLPSHIVVKDAKGAVIPDQLLNSKPEEHQDNYESIIFQHDFAAGERTATFTLEKSEAPVPPFPTKVFARYVPERFDDFAWENDRVAHRIYGPGLGTPVAGKSQMFSSGVDIWCKRVRYPIIDRWYLMGHYHEDTGEGLDMYDVGKSRGCGGTGVWDGKKLFVSQNWKSWKVLANGPVRVVFELTYDPWDAGNGVNVSETKRFTLDAGHNLDEVESTFSWPQNKPTPLVIGIGIAKHTKGLVSAEATQNEKGGWFSFWEKFQKDGQLGTGVVLPAGTLSGFAEDDSNHLVLTKAKSGESVRYYLGGGWDGSGDFLDKASWEKYLEDFAARLKSPVKVSFSEAK